MNILSINVIFIFFISGISALVNELQFDTGETKTLK